MTTDDDMACVIHLDTPKYRYEVHGRKNGKTIRLHASDNEAQAWWIFETNMRLKRYTGIYISFNHEAGQ
jgi:hypothetical protein